VAWPLPFSVPVAPKAAKVAPPSELTLKITVPVGVTPALVTVAVSVILPPTVIVVADSRVVVVETAYREGDVVGIQRHGTISSQQSAFHICTGSQGDIREGENISHERSCWYQVSPNCRPARTRCNPNRR